MLISNSDLLYANFENILLNCEIFDISAAANVHPKSVNSPDTLHTIINQQSDK